MRALRNITRSYHHYAFAAVALWSLAYVLTKLAMEHFSAPALGLWRCLIAAAVLVAVMAVRGGVKAPTSADAAWFLLSGITGLSGYLLLFNYGTKMLSPTTSCIVISTAPVFTALFASAVFRERLGPAGWLAIFLAFAGILVMTLWNGTLELNEGVLWVGAAAMGTGCYNLLQRSLAKRHSSMQITACSFIAATATLLPFLPEAARQLAAAPAWLAASVVVLGVFPSAFAYLLWVRALSLAEKTSQAAAYMFLTPFLALMLEFAVLGQYPGAGTFVGGAIIMGGLVLFARRKGG